MNDRSNDRSATEPAAIKLLDAVERMFTDESPSTVSMRTIAAEADCSLGLAYNYFDSKTALIGATLDRMAKRVAAAAINTEDPREALIVLLDSLRTDAAFPRLVTWLALEGHDLSNVMSADPLLQGVTAVAAERGAEDPESVALAMAMLALGTFTYGELMNRMTGRQPDDARLLGAAADMFASWFPQPAD